MTIVMKRKVDIYLEHPERFQLDLINQKGIWMDNVVRPLESHYEASRKQIELVKKMVTARKEAQAARLAQIQMYQDIVMSVCFVAVDIIAAGALKNTTILSKKDSSTKDFETFRNSSDNFEIAWKAFTSQKSTMVDAIIGNKPAVFRPSP